MDIVKFGILATAFLASSFTPAFAQPGTTVQQTSSVRATFHLKVNKVTSPSDKAVVYLYNPGASSSGSLTLCGGASKCVAGHTYSAITRVPRGKEVDYTVNYALRGDMGNAKLVLTGFTTPSEDFVVSTRYPNAMEKVTFILRIQGKIPSRENLGLESSHPQAFGDLPSFCTTNPDFVAKNNLWCVSDYTYARSISLPQGSKLTFSYVRNRSGSSWVEKFYSATAIVNWPATFAGWYTFGTGTTSATQAVGLLR